MGNSDVVPLIGFPSPDDFVRGFFDALKGIFGDSVQEAIASALRSLSENTPSLDLSSPVLDRYDGMFAIALLLGCLASAVQLFRIIKLQDWTSVVDFAKIVPLTFMFGTALPYATYLLTDMIGDIHHNIVEWILDKPLDDHTFDFSVSGGFNPFALFVGWVGGGVLQAESYVLVKLMPHMMLVLILVFALRWFGVLGDGLFTISVGIFFTVLFGTTAMILVLSLFFLGASGAFPATYLCVAIFITALMPLVIFIAYFKFGFSQRVKGVMDTRLISSRIGIRNRSNPESGGSGLASKIALASAGAVAGALIARETGGGRPEGTSMMDHQRGKTADRLMMGATMASKSHPVTAVAMLVGSKVLRPRPKPPGEG